jgi:universal stress protein E
MPKIKNILVAVKDPWARKLPAVEKAAQLARALRARLQLFHAMSEPVYVDVADSHGQGLISLEQGQRARVSRRLQVLADRLERIGVAATTIVEWDFPAHEAVIREARRSGADLIVAERHETSHHLPWLLRFTDFELLRLAPVPVLLVKSGKRYSRPRVLAAIDPSHAFAKPTNLDQEILKSGASLAAALGGALHAVYAFDPLPLGPMASEIPLGEAAEAIEETALGRAEKELARALKGTRIPDARRHLVPRHPIDAIEDTVRSTGSSIVVMGAVSRTGLKRLVLGNTAERVLDRLPCDILVVKPKRFVSSVPRARRGAQLIALSALQVGV